MSFQIVQNSKDQWHPSWHLWQFQMDLARIEFHYFAYCFWMERLLCYSAVFRLIIMNFGAEFEVNYLTLFVNHLNLFSSWFSRLVGETRFQSQCLRLIRKMILRNHHQFHIKILGRYLNPESNKKAGGIQKTSFRFFWWFPRYCQVLEDQSLMN